MPLRGAMHGSQTQSAFPLSVSADGRHLVSVTSAKPFLPVGESVWNLVVQPTLAQVATYLSDRKARGVNALLVQLIGTMGNNPPRADGAAGTPQPFTTPGDFSTPNAAYFTHARTVLMMCRDAGMAVFLTPTYYGFNGSPAGQGWYDTMQADTAGHFSTYGAYLATTFGSLNHIVWVAGGDRYPTGQFTRMHNVMNALASGMPGALRTAHWDNDKNTTDVLVDEPATTWINLNAVHRDHDVSSRALDAYNYSPTTPAFHIEGGYKYSFTSPTDQRIREYSWSGILSGCLAGAFAGNQQLWQFGSSFPFSANADWAAELTNSYSSMFAPLASMFSSARAWHLLVPDSSSALVTAGRGTTGVDGYVAAAKTADSTLAIIYVPGGGSITVDLSQMAGSGAVTARWFDPTTGAFTAATGSPLAQSSHAFVASSERGNNAAGAADWVLVLET